MAKRKRLHRRKPRAQRSKRTTTRANAAKKRAPSTEGARQASLHEWLEGVRGFAASQADSGAETGACLVSDPNGGPAMCISTDRQTCKTMKGVFVGGPC
jgi:hypothetical protein